MSRAPRPGRVHLAASPGGHLDILRLAAAGLEGEHVWVTTAGERAEAVVRSSAGRVHVLPHLVRSAPLGVVRNAVQAVALALRERPSTVVTSGAGGVLLFAATARLLGARLVFVETMARIDDASMTGRLLRRVADAVLVQWEETARRYPGAVVCRPSLLEGIPTGPVARGEGTVAVVGTHSEPFDRLLRLVDDAAGRGVLPAPLHVQSGASHLRAQHYVARAYLPADELARLVAAADVVVAHGGAGVLSGALRAGRRPLVVARRAALGEHVDDHQLQLAGKLAELGLAVLVGERVEEADVAAAHAPLEVPAALAARPSVGEALRAALAGLPPRPRRRRRVA